jgi:polygalacturonase
MADAMSMAITECGAKPGERCTQAIQDCIDRMNRQGGGTVVIPDGTWISGTLELKTGVTLHVMPNAVLKASGSMSDFPAIRDTSAESGDVGVHHFILAHDAERVTLTGGGIIDGNGPAFWDMANRRADGWIPTKRPRVSPMLHFARCRRLVLRDIRVQNSPGWTVHPFCCDDVVIDNVRIENDLFGPNTDGIDVNGCRDVFITNSRIVCGDDAIIIKATHKARSTERVLISNCVLQSHCIGVGIGQETESDVRQVTVSNCVMTKCHRMFAIGQWNGGTVEDVTVTGCVGDTLTRFALARPIQLETKRLHRIPNAQLGRMRNIQISNFVARTSGRVMVTAAEPGYIENVVLRDVMLELTGVEDANRLSPPDGKTGSNQYCNENLWARRQHAAVVVENVRNFRLAGLDIHWPRENPENLAFAAVWAKRVEGGLMEVPLVTPFGGAPRAVELEDVDGLVCNGCVSR